MVSTNGAGAQELTPATDFRRMREEGVIQTLLSGRKVRLRTVTPDMLLRTGRVPDILSPLVTRMFFEEVDNAELDAFYQTPRDQVAETLKMIESVNVVCAAALVYPKIVDSPVGDDEISVDDLSLTDRFWIFKLAFQSAEVLSTFRLESLRDVEARDNGEDDPQPTQ